MINTDMNKIIYDVPKSIEEAKSAYRCGFYISCLLLTFSLADKCASVYSEITKAKFNKNRNSERFINWIDSFDRYDEDTLEIYREQMQKHDQIINNINVPYLNGEVIYQIRCCVVHTLSSFNRSLKKYEFKFKGNEKLKYINFSIVQEIDIKDCFFCYGSSIFNNVDGELDVDLGGLIAHLLYLIEYFYDKNKKLFKNDFNVDIYCETN